MKSYSSMLLIAMVALLVLFVLTGLVIWMSG